jgi:hypothetical protein
MQDPAPSQPGSTYPEASDSPSEALDRAAFTSNLRAADRLITKAIVTAVYLLTAREHSELHAAQSLVFGIAEKYGKLGAVAVAGKGGVA